MKKRILLVLLALILSLSCILLASCKGNKDDDDDDDPNDPNNPSDSTTLSNDELNYLRISKIDANGVTVKFNVYKDGLSYDIRYSDKEITADNFDKATKANAEISGSREITAVLKGVKASGSQISYIAAKVAGSDKIETVRAGGEDELLPIDYENITNVYHGESLTNLAGLFDEQVIDKYTGFVGPSTNIGIKYPTGRDNTPNQNDIEGKVGMTLSPIVDLEYMHYVSKVSVFFGQTTGNLTVRWSKTPVDFQAENSKWDGYAEYSVEEGEVEANRWIDTAVGADARFIQVCFKDGNAPNEIFIFGYQNGEGDKISTSLHKLPTVGEMMGMCGFVGSGGGYTSIEQVSAATVLREYHNFGWAYTVDAYPAKANKFSGTMGNFAAEYKNYQAAGILVVPCIQLATHPTGFAYSVDEDGLPKRDSSKKLVVASYFEKFDPRVYFTYADNMFAFAGIFGSTSTPELLATLKAHTATSVTAAGQGTIKWLEFGNEPNGEDSLGYVPYQLAALQSASYDGHQKTIPQGAEEGLYHLGAKNADPNMKIAMAGLAGIGSRYITAMCYWMRANRTDGDIAMDAFNFHSYFSVPFHLNGSTISVGVSPEYYGIVDKMASIIEFRNKYYPEKEIWITEFGWDTNPSYETITACHAYGEYNSHQIQAMWLVRAYLLMSSCGVDKATMYMCEDLSYDVTAVGKYDTCGIFGIDENGKQYAKDSYYYMYTLKNTLGDYTFQREINTGNENVWAYEYKNAEGKIGYAVWCPTMDGTKVPNFQLNIGASSATLIEAVDNDKDGVSTDLTATDGKVTINVSENPVFVMVK